MTGRLCLLGLLAAVACAQPPGSPPQAPAPGAPSAGGSMERQAFSLVNEARRAQGCPLLAWNDTAAAVAQAHSADMARRNFFGHVNPDGVNPGRRLMLAGIAWRRVAENVALNPGGSAHDVVGQWLGSPAHRANVMTCDLTHTGIGHASGRWTQVFFTRP